MLHAYSVARSPFLATAAATTVVLISSMMLAEFLGITLDGRTIAAGGVSAAAMVVNGKTWPRFVSIMLSVSWQSTHLYAALL